MAKQSASAPADYDGRFGAQFDDEIDTGSIWKILASLGVITVLFMVAMVFLWHTLVGQAEERGPAPMPMDNAHEAGLPPAPRLQTDPEDELEALRRAMHTRLSGYGWVDEHAGIVHIPIEKAMDVLVARGPDSLAAVEGDDAAAGDTGHGTVLESDAETTAANANQGHGG